jgi:hypothetical protein
MLPALLAGCLLAPASASAAGIQTTWDQAAADLDFPVYQPADTLGLKLTAISLPTCEGDAELELPVAAVYGNRRSSKGFFSVTESFPLCSPAGEERVVRRVKINGVNVDVAVKCRPTSCHVRAKDGVELGYRLLWRKGSRTFVDLRSRRLSLAKVLRVARSLTRVTLDRPTVQLVNFLTPDRQVWCGFATLPTVEAQAFCGTKSASAEGSVKRDGTLDLCNHPNPTPDTVCLQNFDDQAPVLNVGQASEFSGFRCVSALEGMTCTVIDGGPGNGKGFQINASTVTPVGI